MNSRIDEIIELVVEGLSEAAALQLAGKLLQRSVAPRTNEDATLDEEIPALRISEKIVIRRPHVRLLCYGECLYDVEINFAISDVEQKFRSRLAADLQTFAMRLTSSVGEVTVFAGLEPASDEDTRIFSGQQLGPLRLDSGTK